MNAGTPTRQHATPTVVGRRLDLRTELLVLTLVVAETAAAWLLLRLYPTTAPPRESGMRPLVLFGLLYAAVQVPRLLEAFDVWDPTYELVMAAALVASGLIAVKVVALSGAPWFDVAWLRAAARSLALRSSNVAVPIWGVVAVVLAAWWRGRHRAEPSLDAAYRALRTGFAVVLVGTAVDALVATPAHEEGATGAVLVFFCASLAAIALARLRTPRSQDAANLGQRWILAFIFPIAVIIGLAVIATGIFSQNFLNVLLLTLSPLIWAGTVAARLAILLAAIIAFIIVSPILWLLSGRTLRVPQRAVPGLSGDEVDRIVDRLPYAATVPDAIRYLLVAGLLLVTVSALVRFALRRWLRSPLPSDEERESVLDLLRDLKAAVRGAQRLIGRRQRRQSDTLTTLRGDPRWAATVTIRQIYRRFLIASREQGAPRAASVTPQQHGLHLGQMLHQPGTIEDVQVITDGYNQARYGALPATVAEADAVEAAWQRLRRLLTTPTVIQG